MAGVSDAQIQIAARKTGVPFPILRAQVYKESGGRQGALSPKGASGVEQLMPGTAAYEGRTHRLNTNTPMGNLLAGAFYLREQYNAFKRWDLALAAYNAGPGAVHQYHGVPPYHETQDYVSTIMREFRNGGLSTGPGPRASTKGPQPEGFDVSVPQVDLGALAKENLSALSTGQYDPTAELSNIHAAFQKAAKLAKATPLGQAQPQFQIQGKPTPHDMAAVALAKHYLGTPYAWGGESPKGFDCSGLLQYVWAQKGVRIPRTTYEQFQAGQSVGRKALRPGDAVFFTGSDPKNGLPGHVGIYIGGGKFIESPHTGATVRISKLAGRKDFVGARRYG